MSSRSDRASGTSERDPDDVGYFANNGVDNPPLHALKSGVDGANGVFHEGSSDAFPDQTSNASNYWADVVFSNPDTAPPVISSVVASASTAGNATVTWTTDELSDSSVAYGTAANALNTTESDPALVTSHSVTLQGLTPGTTYFYRVTSTDRAANSATSPASPAAPASFTVPTFAATDTTTADFSAGTPGACAVVAHTGDGEVELTPTVRAEFAGTALPAGWESTLWDSSGSATVAGGQLALNTARAGTTASYSAGHSVEFVATFANESFQHVGFGTDFNAGPWAIFSTGSDAGTLKARTNDGSNSTDTVLAGNLLGSPHRFRIDWTSSQVVYWVDGTQVASHTRSPLRCGRWRATRTPTAPTFRSTGCRCRRSPRRARSCRPRSTRARIAPG